MKITYQDLQKKINTNYLTAIIYYILMSYLVVFAFSFIFPSFGKLYIPMTFTGILIGIQQQFMHNSKLKNNRV